LSPFLKIVLWNSQVGTVLRIKSTNSMISKVQNNRKTEKQRLPNEN
jgi:hypothetical protein